MSHCPARCDQVRWFNYEVRDIPQCWEVSTDWRFPTSSTGAAKTKGAKKRIAVNFLEKMASIFGVVRMLYRSYVVVYNILRIADILSLNYPDSNAN